MIIFSSKFVSGCMLEMPTPPVFFLLHPSAEHACLSVAKPVAWLDHPSVRPVGCTIHPRTCGDPRRTYLKKMLGGALLRRMPTDSNSLVRISLWPVGLLASRT
jgi:hypothetical protein